MIIGIKLEDRRINNMDLSTPEVGNPGVGGSTYEAMLLAKYLSFTHKVIVYHTNASTILPDKVVSRVVENELKMPEMAKIDNIDIFIYAAGRTKEWYKEITSNQVTSVVWAHCYLNYFELKTIRENNCVKRVVFVGQEEYSAYVADDIIEKSTYIYNMYNSEKYFQRIENNRKIVVYLGSLNRDKGFHVLAKAWKKVVEVEPEAKLMVLGTGQLYGRETVLGKYGIATPNYERKFIKYLIDGQGRIIDSVNFCGIVGADKAKYIGSACVGVVNPTGRTETFCISAVEIEACGVPICTTGKYGLLDTVINNKTGLFSNTSEKLSENIITLIQDKELNRRLSNGARQLSLKFMPSKLVPEWNKMFEEIENGTNPTYREPMNIGNSRRIKLKKFIRYLRKDKKLHVLPSFIAFEYIFQGMWRVWIRDIVDVLKQWVKK